MKASEKTALDIAINHSAAARRCRSIPACGGKTYVSDLNPPADAGRKSRARVVIVGEAPGSVENAAGRPFAGASGKILDDALQRAGLDRNDVFITNTVNCLDGTVMVKTEIGDLRISWIVKNFWKGKVLSVDENNDLCWKDIVDWHVNQRASRRLYKVYFANGKKNPRGTAGCIATGDHKFLTNNGWKAVAEIQPFDLVATGTPSPNYRAKQVIMGSLLGDGCVDKGGYYSETHCIAQKEYLKLKARVLTGFCPTLREYKIKIKKIDKSCESISCFLKKSFYFKDLRTIWYPSGIKKMDVCNFTDLDTLGLAIWYMDDGYWQPRCKHSHFVQIALGKMPREEARSVANFMVGLGFDTHVIYDKMWRLFFRTADKSGFQFLENIASYIPDCMRYKIPDELHSIPFDEKRYLPEPVSTYWKNIEIIPYTSSHYNTVYCIDVEDTHNFVTVGGVVHNCELSRETRGEGHRRPTTAELDACLPLLQSEIDALKPAVIITMGGVAKKSIAAMDFPGTRVLNSVHPAAGMHRPSIRASVKEEIDRTVKEAAVLARKRRSI